MTLVASPMYQNQFTGRTAVVTGAGRGIGLAIAQSFAESGASVLLIDRDEVVEESAETLRAAGYDVRGLRADVTDEEAMKSAFRWVDELWGRLDVLVNNAGIITISNLDDLSLAEFQRVLNVNTTAMFLCCREAAPLLRKSPSGVILNAASGQARQGFIYTPHYAASKFGVVGLSQSLAKELAADNIRVNSYCPGIVKTDMWQYNDREWGKRLGDYAPGELIQEWIDDIPLKRAAEASDVANLLLFLASDAASYITGQAINIDGGMFMS
ncbi:SDR family NAD(P)-dependent oxidoreductase [Subtercola endophyticus]|uniref:SDR family NAD(P)-dependent oxidoreductase n=1 Tax=Subtercola endophyticus TaxID=2895559 RepID=UPI001E50CEEC|nr:SDR family NAD(P)-dependent oxidoreductase [Subtercola endophyticus]UFS58093.1 SDR family oxidoreductase [Subtercola endophyticus]